MTGFRLDPHSTHWRYGVTPDMTTFAETEASSGYQMAGFGGRRRHHGGNRYAGGRRGGDVGLVGLLQQDVDG